MNRSEIAESISGANSALNSIKKALTDFDQGGDCTKAAVSKNENSYKGASSNIISTKLSDYLKVTINYSSQVEQKKNSIKTRINELDILDRQLADEERRAAEAAAEAARKAANHKASLNKK